MNNGNFFLILSGLCTLSSCLSHQYHYVSEAKTWTEAQRYCREKHTDLATVNNMEEMTRLINTVDKGYNDRVWIGLYDGGIDSWRWSLGEKGADKMFMNWLINQPNNYNREQKCVNMQEDGTWNDFICTSTKWFTCYDERALAQKYVLIQEAKTWEDAQSYCRENHTDLVRVDNQTQNDQIKSVAIGRKTWIGLFRDSWKWSDQSNSSFRYWQERDPNHFSNSENCAAIWTNKKRMVDHQCNKPQPFLCYGALKTKKTVLRLKIRSDADLINQAVSDQILQQLHEALTEKGMTDFKLRWRTQPDGQIFHKEEDNEDGGEK